MSITFGFWGLNVVNRMCSGYDGSDRPLWSDFVMD